MDEPVAARALCEARRELASLFAEAGFERHEEVVRWIEILIDATQVAARADVMRARIAAHKERRPTSVILSSRTGDECECRSASFGDLGEHSFVLMVHRSGIYCPLHVSYEIVVDVREEALNAVDHELVIDLPCGLRWVGPGQPQLWSRHWVRSDAAKPGELQVVVRHE